MNENPWADTEERTELAREPRVHGFATELLPDARVRALLARDIDSIDCTYCGEMLHFLGNNEVMREWVETGAGNFCMVDFLAAYYTCNPRDLALPLDDSRDQVLEG